MSGTTRIDKGLVRIEEICWNKKNRVSCDVDVLTADYLRRKRKEVRIDISKSRTEEEKNVKEGEKNTHEDLP